MEGIDPNRCGFNIDENTLNSIKQTLDNGQFFRRQKLAEKGLRKFNRIAGTDDWVDIQKMIPETIENSRYGEKQFFEWFKDFDIMKNVEESKLSQVPRLFLGSFFAVFDPLVNLFPSNLQKIVKQIEEMFLGD